MKINELEKIIKKATSKEEKSEDPVEKKVEKEKSASSGERDLFGQPIGAKQAMHDGHPEGGSSEPTEDGSKVSLEDDDNEPKGLPKRPVNSDKNGDEAETEDITVPNQSNDAVTGTGDGSPY